VPAALLPCNLTVVPRTAPLIDRLAGHPMCPADGRFRGWVAPAVCERYGIAEDPDAAWEAGGGGKFSFKIDKKGGRPGGGWVLWVAGWVGGPGVAGCVACWAKT
jgi:hypothetical protein